MSDRVVAVIHAKGNSERLTRKNFCLIGGVPLFLAQAQNISNLLPKSHIYIDSEDDEILTLSELCGFRSLQRDPQKASNDYGGVQLLKDFLKKVDATTVVQLFPPMPFLDVPKLEEMITHVRAGSVNSAFFLESDHLYTWSNTSPDYAFNADGEIPNSKDLQATQYELPTVYVVNVDEFRATNNRTCQPSLRHQTSHKYNRIDIDTAEDLFLAKSLYKAAEIKKRFCWSASVVRFAPPIIFWQLDDLLLGSGGENKLRNIFNTSQKEYVDLLTELGIQQFILISDKDEKESLDHLEIEFVLVKQDELETCIELAQALSFSFHECFFFGSANQHSEVMDAAGLSFFLADGCSATSQSDWIGLCGNKSERLFEMMYAYLTKHKYMDRGKLR